MKTCQQLMRHLFAFMWNIKRLLIFMRYYDASVYYIRKMFRMPLSCWHQILNPFPAQVMLLITHNPWRTISNEAPELVNKVSPKVPVGKKKETFDVL